MIKKIYLFFFVIFIIFFNISFVSAQNPTVDTLKKIGEVTDDLKNVEKLPIVEDIGTIARAIREVTETYQSIKSKIKSTISYCQNAINSITEIWNKIESGGIKVKNYIENILGSNYKKYSIYLTLN
jgi:phage-related protein